MRFFYYCFYRLSSAYKRLTKKHYCDYGDGLLSMCQIANVLSLLAIIYAISGETFDKLVIYCVMVPIFIINTFFIYTKRKYVELSERWKDERYKRLKGWLVALYVVASFAFYFITLGIMMKGWWIR